MEKAGWGGFWVESLERNGRRPKVILGVVSAGGVLKEGGVNQFIEGVGWGPDYLKRRSGSEGGGGFGRKNKETSRWTGKGTEAGRLSKALTSIALLKDYGECADQGVIRTGSEFHYYNSWGDGGGFCNRKSMCSQ